MFQVGKGRVYMDWTETLIRITTNVTQGNAIILAIKHTL